MSYTLRAITESDAPRLAEIFNQFVEHSFAAYPSVRVDESMYHRLKGLAGQFPFYAIDNDAGLMIGFALIRAYHPADTLKHTAEITIFLLPEFTHKGMGTAILQRLENEAKAMGVETLVASASSLNEQSLNFQRRNGFVECGRFVRVGRKFGREFDMVWMQKWL